MIIDGDTREFYLVVKADRPGTPVGLVKHIDTEKKTITRLVPSATTKGFDEVTESLEEYWILKKIWP